MLEHILHRLFRRGNQRGQNTIEVLMSMAILAVAAQATTIVIRQAGRGNVANRDRMVAMEKALQMLEELRSVVLDESQQITTLDQPYYNDGYSTTAPFSPNYRYTLTTRTDITQPAGNPVADYLTGVDPLSGNPLKSTGYAYVRNVVIQGYSNTSGAVIDPNVRKIWVRVFAAKANAGSASYSTPTPQDPNSPLAQVYGMVHSLGASNPPVQVLDLYFLGVENVPGWWAKTADLIPIMNDAAVSMQSRNPGLQIRTHWIKTLSFGRDFEYTPEYNLSNLSNANGAFQKTYIYPGTAQFNNGTNYTDQFYYLNEFQGRLNVDGTLLNNNTVSGNFAANMGYPLADQFNHSMLEPDEERIWNVLNDIATNNGVAPPEKSWRMILDRLNSANPNAPNNGDFPLYQNSIFVNLHGEMLPMPPLRNYADAAKDPDFYWFHRVDALGNTLTPRAWRAVSHAERLAYSSVTGTAVPCTVTVRVYAWDMNPPADPITTANENDLVDTITLFIPGATKANVAEIDKLVGNSHTHYTWVSYPAASMVSTGGDLMDITPSASSSFWIHDGFGPSGRHPPSTVFAAAPSTGGLRIVLQGTTPTARLYVGP